MHVYQLRSYYGAGTRALRRVEGSHACCVKAGIRYCHYGRRFCRCCCFLHPLLFLLLLLLFLLLLLLFLLLLLLFLLLLSLSLTVWSPLMMVLLPPLPPPLPSLLQLLCRTPLCPPFNAR